MKMLLLRTAPRKVPFPILAGCLVVAVCILFFCLSVEAKEASKPEAAPNAAKQRASKAPQSKRKLSEKEQRALRLLQAAEAESGDLEPEMRAHVLWQIASGYRLLSDQHADMLLRKAFEISLAIDCQQMEEIDQSSPVSCQIKETLQRRILENLFFQSGIGRTATEQLLPRALPSVKQELTREIAIQYAREKKFEKAISLLQELSRAGEFPYAVAETLINTLPEERNAERTQLFALAFEAFRQERSDSLRSVTAFDRLVVSTWTNLPRPMVAEALDGLLQRAKDQEADSGNKRAVTITTTKGVASFGSLYEFELLQLLPIIRDIDSARAESLLSDAAQMRANLAKFPAGIQWPNYKGDSKQIEDDAARITSMSITSSANEGNSKFVAQEFERGEISLRMRAIIKESTTDPESALAAALSLPQEMGYNTPRARALIGVAGSAIKNKPAVAKRALESLESCLASVSTDDEVKLLHKGDMLGDGARDYIRLADNDSALKMVHEVTKVAEELYANDTQSGDPNQAIKALWPSTTMWRIAISTAAGISTDAAEEIIAGISDPEIKVQEKVTFARALLGDDFVDLDFVDQRNAGIKNAFF